MIEDTLNNQFDIREEGDGGFAGGGTGPTSPTVTPPGGAEPGPNYNGPIVQFKALSDVQGIAITAGDDDIGVTPLIFDRTFESLLGQGIRFEAQPSDTRQPVFYYRVRSYWELVNISPEQPDIPTINPEDGGLELESPTGRQEQEVTSFTRNIPRIVVEKFDRDGVRINNVQHNLDDISLIELSFETEEIELEPEIASYSVFVQSVTNDDRITGTDREQKELVDIITGNTDGNVQVVENGTFISGIGPFLLNDVKFSIPNEDYRVVAIRIWSSNGDIDYIPGRLLNTITDQQEYAISSINQDLFIEFEYELAAPRENETYVPEVSLITPTISYDFAEQGDITFFVSKMNATGVRAVDWKGNEYTFDSGDSQFTRVSIPREVVTDIGQRTVSIIPFDDNGDGIPKQQVINIIDATGILDARFDTIEYPSIVKGNDFQGYDVDFSVVYTTTNADFVNIYIGNQNRPYGDFAANKTVTFNVQKLINNYRIGAGNERQLEFDIRFVPVNNRGDGQAETLSITFDKSRVQLPTPLVEEKLEEALLDDVDISNIDVDNTKYLSHIANIDGQDFSVIANWDRDDVTFTEFEEDELGNEIPVDGVVNSSLILKLFEPLPRSVQPNTQLWISKLKATPFIDRVTLREESEEVCIRLRPPNFDIEPSKGSIGYQIYDDIIASGSETSEELVRRFVKQRGINDVALDISYYDEETSTLNFHNFIHFSSAEAQLLNYDYKVKQLNAYNDRLSQLQTITTSSIAQVKEEERIRDNINTLIGNFTGLEQTLYTDLQLQDSTVPSYDATLDSLVADAVDYDRNNENSLTYNSNLPRHILTDDANESFILFLEMVGQHFDILWSYINGLKQTNIVEHKKDEGIIDDIVYHMLESFGWDVESTAATQQLWQKAFGQNRDKEVLPGTDGDTELFASGDTYQDQIWRRILNNLPFLLKHKGTKRSLSAILSIYGVPNSLLSIVEFGGPIEDEQEPLKVSFDDKTTALETPDVTSYIRHNWLQNSTFDATFDFTFGDYPGAFELRILPDSIAQSTLIEADGWKLDLIPTTGINGKLAFEISGSVIAETNDFPFFNNEYSQVALTKAPVSGSLVQYTISAAEGFQGRIRAHQTAEATIQEGPEWGQGTQIRICETFIGNIDEYRLWRVALNEEAFLNHTLSPDSIDGNELKSSTEDLLIRYDFEVPKNRHSSGDPNLMNVAPAFQYQANGLAIGFPDRPDYPFSHTVYTRGITATVPSIGFNYSDKTRVEDIELVAPLSSRERSTIKAFDRAPVDSNRLGLFLSPIKEVNFDIIKKFGSKFRIDDYIGNPADEYRSEYTELKGLREYYFSFINLDIYEYVQLVQYIDRTLFDVLEKMIPARVLLSKGLLFENHILTRSKVDWTKPTGSDSSQEADIKVNDDVETLATTAILNAIIENADETKLAAERLEFEGLIDEQDVEDLQFTFSDLVGLVDNPLEEDLEASYVNYEMLIDATFGATVTGYAEAFGEFTAVATNGDENPSVVGFSFFGESTSPGFVIRNKLTRGGLIKERLYVELITEERTFNKRSDNVLVSGSSGFERVDQIIEVTETDTRVNIRPAFQQSGPNSGSLQNPTPIQGDIVDVRPLVGYLPSHFKFTGDQTTGLKRSFYAGSRNTSETTIDGASAVETFITNPNTLRVSEAGRGSGEPILRVDGDDE